MKLLTKKIRDSLPKLGTTQNEKDPLARVKFFFPAGCATWFATEYDGKDTFFGWAMLYPGCGELGYFSLSEMESVSVMGLHVERDLYFKPTPLSQATKKYQN